MSVCEPVSPQQERINARYRFRRELFMRRGWSLEKASLFGYRLERRDAERDDRRACIECQHLQPHKGTCFIASQGKLKGAVPYLTPVQDILQRCDGFAFVKP